MASVTISDILVTCTKAALVAQQYTAVELLRLRDVVDTTRSPARTILQLPEAEKAALIESLNSAVRVDVKDVLTYKKGSASQDLVTSADVLTQAIIGEALARAFPAEPFTVVGEEDAATDEVKQTARRCLDTYWESAAVPLHDELTTRAAAHPSCDRVEAASLDALRARVGIFIDPIDGTNCFVDGTWEAPMTLVGITVDGVPVASVVNRIFLYPLRPGTSESSLSYIWAPGADAQRGAPFMVHEGHAMDVSGLKPPPLAAPGDCFRVVESSTTEGALLHAINEKLAPTALFHARGAGNKLFLLIEGAMHYRGESAQRQLISKEPIDLFLCPGNTIKRWDTCAPHAFLLALEGEIYSADGVPVRYPLEVDASLSAEAQYKKRTELPDGLVAANLRSKKEVARRLGW